MNSAHQPNDVCSLVARHLHDTVLQEIAALRWVAVTSSPEDVDDHLGRLFDHVSDIVDILAEGRIPNFEVSFADLEGGVEFETFLASVHPQARLQLRRSVAEAVTNASKYGQGRCEVRLCLRLGDDVTKVVVTNPRPPSTPDSPSNPGSAAGRRRRGAGYGLRSVRADLAAVGGSLRLSRNKHTMTATVSIPTRWTRRPAGKTAPNRDHDVDGSISSSSGADRDVSRPGPRTSTRGDQAVA